MNQENKAARISKVFASTNVRPSGATAPAETTPTAVSSSDEDYAQNGQDRKLAQRRRSAPVEPGFPVGVIVNRDLVLERYKG